MPLLPGEILNRRYRIICLLGQGAYGAVYRAWDMEDELDLAIKEYLDPSVDTQRLFRAEARQLSRLNHPQLPRVRDHFALEESGQYLVSDYIEGVDLQSLLRQYGPLPSDLIVPWLQQVCQPLHYLHEQKQLHLNVKPANIRLTPAGEIYLVDTGLPGVGIRPGNNGFTAPEQQKQTAVDVASDIYSLGATLYTLLTDTEPQDALRRESGLADLKSAREVNANVEPYLSIVAARAMDLRPEVRYEMVTDFAKALARPAGRPAPDLPEMRRTVSDQPLPPKPYRTQPSRRDVETRTVLGLLALLIIAIGIGLGLGFVNRSVPVGGSEAAATATTMSQLVDALTQIAPTATLTPFPTDTPEPTPLPIVNDTGSVMLYVPGGIFRMGNEEGENDEQPSHIVRLEPYYIDQTEVTNAEYLSCVQTGACRAPVNQGASYHDDYFGDPRYDEYPVIFVSWYDAETFCAWRGARLPSEAEWERAAGYDPVQSIRYLYPWGDTFDGRQLNYCDSSCPNSDRDTRFDDEHADTAPVASFADGQSPLGLFDMAGNVMEWVSDWYDRDYYAESETTNPVGPVEGTAKSLRGGSWLSEPDEVTVTGRGAYDPTVARANLGFRCAMDLP